MNSTREIFLVGVVLETEEREGGLRNWSDPENAAGPALTSNEE